MEPLDINFVVARIRPLGSTIKNGHREQSEPGSIYEVAIGMSGSLLVPSLGPRH